MKRNLIKKLKVSKRIFIFAILALLLGGYLIIRNFFPSKKGFKEAKVEKGTVKEELILSGEIKADEHARLSFLTSGELDYLGVTEGQKVKKGEVLAKLDTTVLYQTYLSAEADLRRFDASRDKIYDDLQGHEKDESYEQIELRTIAETNRDKAYRAYIAAQKNLDNAILKAPFDGIIASITHPYTGVNTSLTESQIEIVNPETIYFQVTADQTEVNKIRKDQEVEIILDAFPNEEYKGKVEYVGFTPKAGELGTVYSVKVRMVESIDISKVRIGMTGDAKFVTSKKDNVLYIPSTFINSDSKGRFVYLKRPKNKVYVEIGLEGEEFTQIISEKVKENDKVFD